MGDSVLYVMSWLSKVWKKTDGWAGSRDGIDVLNEFGARFGRFGFTVFVVVR